jgi:hypothetical protein
MRPRLSLPRSLPQAFELPRFSEAYMAAIPFIQVLLRSQTEMLPLRRLRRRKAGSRAFMGASEAGLINDP